MGKAKGRPDKVNPVLAEEAWKRAKGNRQATYSQYIKLHYQATGNLAPGCNSQDLQAWLDERMGGMLS